MRRPALCTAVLAALVAAVLLVPSAADAAKKKESFRHPDLDSFQVRSIGILPVALLRPDKEAVGIVREAVERAVAPSGYRFLGESVLHAAAHSAAVDTAFDQLEASWRKSGKLDTTSLKAIGRARVADAVLAVMVTTWDRLTIDPSVAGESSTQIGVRLSLYSTRSGELLWQEAFLEEGRGPYNNPSEESVVGVRGSSIGNTARTSTALDPPTFDEIADKLTRKVQAKFPVAAKQAAGTLGAGATQP